MGKLNGILPIQGTVGNITFAKTGDGIIVRQKGGVSAKRIATDPAFRRTRENNSEFGRAGKAGKMILSALRSTARAKADSRATSRLVKVLMAAQKGDTTSPRGQRRISLGAPTLLEGFQLNHNAPLASTLYAPYTLLLDRAAGIFELGFLGPLNEDSIKAPEGATDYTIQLSCVSLDFDTLTSSTVTAASAMVSINTSVTLAALHGTFTPNTTTPLLVLLSVTFYQTVNGQPYLLSNGSYNPAAIIDVAV